MPDRVVVFLDYQNIYRGARDAFHAWDDPPQAGQIDPVRLAELLVRRSPFDRELNEIRIYRGRPDSLKEPVGYGANLRQCSTWERDPRVTVITRTLRYPARWPAEKAEEKGIDVALAVDAVAMAVRGEYEIALIMSTDTDLKPALEAIAALGGNPFPRCEVAAWSSPVGHSRRLSIRNARLWCHWLEEADYRQLADPTDYKRA